MFWTRSNSETWLRKVGHMRWKGLEFVALERPELVTPGRQAAEAASARAAGGRPGPPLPNISQLELASHKPSNISWLSATPYCIRPTGYHPASEVASQGGSADIRQIRQKSRVRCSTTSLVFHHPIVSGKPSIRKPVHYSVLKRVIWFTLPSLIQWSHF